MSVTEGLAGVSSHPPTGGGPEQGAPRALPISPEARASVSILIIDDERTLRESCATVLRAEGYNVTVSGRGQEALDLVKRRPFDIVLIDLYMSQVSGMELLRAVVDARRGTIAIVMTGNPSVATSIEALRAGAWDYLPKPFGALHLQVLIGRAAHTVLVGRESEAQRADLGAEAGDDEQGPVLGASPAFRQVIGLARKVAATDASVLITGESGSGKEMIAQFIHQHSRRSARPLVAINCAALPEALLESEMFGHVKGAFTGAIRDKAGLLEVANGGTLFLDELIEMPKPIQAKLLRVIQDGVVRRVGSETTDAVVNVRFIAATNRDTDAAVKNGQLREDLYYRLRVVPIHMPALRERPDDIAVLASHFLASHWARHRDAGAPVPKLTSAAMQALRAYPWPGNVRELQNVMEHAVVLLDPGADVRPEDIPFLNTANGRGEPDEISFDVAPDETYHQARERLIGAFERRYLTRLVQLAGGNMSKAARVAGVDRTTLYRLMERHGLRRELLGGGEE
jgi:DNA-binding NtrC family response regulator